jgi:hypothetical protein
MSPGGGFMPFAIHPLKLDYSSRRFVVWMAIGTAFILTLVAADFFSGSSIW